MNNIPDNEELESMSNPPENTTIIRAQGGWIDRTFHSEEFVTWFFIPDPRAASNKHETESEK